MPNIQTEQLKPTQIEPAQAAALGEIVASNMGVADPGDAQTTHLKTIEVGGVSAETNLPVDPFENPSAPYAYEYIQVTGPKDAQIKPSKLDEMPNGSYWVRSASTEHHYERTITLTDVPGGTALSVDSLVGRLYGRRTNQEVSRLRAGKLLEKLGYVVESYDVDGTHHALIKGIPTPETLKNLAKQECGTDVRLFPGSGSIPIESYVQAFAEGTYPVSTGTQLYYGHDTDPADHLMGVLMGGAQVRELLMKVSNDALQSGADLSKLALGIDLFTAKLGHVLLGEEKGVGLDHIAQRYFGIDKPIAAGIIESTLHNAREHGLQVDHTEHSS